MSSQNSHATDAINTNAHPGLTSPIQLPSGVANYYNVNSTVEHARLVSGRVEFEISLRTILSNLPHPETNAGKLKGLRIADIGGGTGRYAVALAQLGHSVTLLDISQSELDIASSHAAASNVQLEGIRCADASDLFGTCPSLLSQVGTFDAVLLMGPLYHLLEQEERERAVSDAGRLLRHCTTDGGGGGVLFASFLTTFGHLRGAARKDAGRLGREWGFYGGYLGVGLKDGEGEGVRERAGKYTRRKGEGVVSFHVHPSEIGGILEKSGLKSESKDEGEQQRRFGVEKLVACEGFLGADLAENLNGLESEEWRAWMDVLCKFADDQCVLGASEHLLAVARLVDI
ncbi:S-adenosyl-L-methionine-dependent methyltransferase [Rhexocercosporidium sp. MPI-PUGE-AT-0058]|nr:S-adenosyl-L-methionine-dependent methyltransferase [Rhexocercosporidium sp. MPI-PUGE-AT-0058]